MSKFAEQLSILLGAADGLFARLHRVETLFTNPKTCPAFVTNKAFEKVAAAFDKSFPKLPPDPAKVPGYVETVQSAASSLFEVLAPHYYAFVDLEDWMIQAKATLLEVGRGATAIKYDANTTLTEAFLDLLQIYVRLLFVLQKVSQRALIMCTFARAYFHVKFIAEPSFDRVAAFVQLYSEVIPCLQNDFRPIANVVVDAVMSLQMPLLQNMDPNALRDKGVHSLTLKPDAMALPSDDAQLYDLVTVDRMHARVLYCLLPCAEAYTRLNPQFLATVLQESLHTPLFRDLSIDMMARYNFMIKAYKPRKGDVSAEMAKELTKSMAVVKKCIGDAEKSVERNDFMALHAQRRVYVRQEMQSLLSLLTDKPGLLGPKMTLLLSCLAYARHELMWLSRHRCTQLPKGSKLKEEDFVDRHDTDMVYLITQLSALALKHSDLVRDYYAAFLSGADLRTAQAELATLQLPPTATKVRAALDAVLSELQSLAPGAPRNLDAMRLNLLRVEAWLSTTESGQYVDQLKSLLQRFATVQRHSEYVDRLAQLLDRHVALDDLWHFREALKQGFVNATAGGPTQPMRCMVYLRLLAAFANRPNPHCPDEQVSRGKACVILGRHFLERIAACINNGLVTVALQFAQYDDQLTEVNAGLSVLQDWSGWKPPKDFVPPTFPGTESLFAQRPALANLAATQSTVFQLCSALNEDVSIQIHDTIFTPREYVRDRLSATLNDFLLRKAMVGTVLERPVLLERRINNFCAVFILVENYLDMSLSSVFRDAFLSQVHQLALPELGSVGNAGALPPPSEWSETMIRPLVEFYAHFVSVHLMEGDRAAIIWSPARKSFVSRTGHTFRAEEYVNLTEMLAMCRLIGPYGVKLLDREVLKVVAQTVRKLKEVLAENRVACLEMQKSVDDREWDAVTALKRFTHLDSAVALLVNVGLALHFRELVHEALGYVMEAQVPFLHSAIKSAFLQYAPNTFMSEEFVACDLLAAECGIAVGTADQALKLALKDAIGGTADDVQLWSLLPTLTAASFITKSWLEADFRTALEGYRTNLHCVAKGFTSLIVCFKGLTSQTRNELEIKTLLELFVEQGSVLLLRTWSMDPKLLLKIVPVPSPAWTDCIVFLDMFVEQSTHLERESLERVLPYALLRSLYNTVYTTKEEVKGSSMATMRSSNKRKEALDGI